MRAHTTGSTQLIGRCDPTVLEVYGVAIELIPVLILRKLEWSAGAELQQCSLLYSSFPFLFAFAVVGLGFMFCVLVAAGGKLFGVGGLFSLVLYKNYGTGWPGFEMCYGFQIYAALLRMRWPRQGVID